jgi:hypothetical protein
LEESEAAEDVRDLSNSSLPAFGIVMKVGPHSGMSLDQIVDSKRAEEADLGVHYWGYSGTSCHPRRVLEFVRYVLSVQWTPPTLLLLETDSAYRSHIGHARRFSRDGEAYETIASPVQLQGAQYAFVCRDLKDVNRCFPMDGYSVVGGKNDGVRLSAHLRHRVNKALVRKDTTPEGAAHARLAYQAQLVEPFVVWLGV